MTEIKVGDEVKVFDVNGHRFGQPEDGWDGIVVKVGRKLVDIKYNFCTKKFRLDTRSANDAFKHQYFKTQTEVEATRVRDDLIEKLESFGFKLKLQANVSTEVIETVVRALQNCEDGQS